MAANGSVDWIELWLDYTHGIPSPEIFRLWCGIAAIGGALERRVWLELSGGPLFPNLYTVLVGRPGVGKTQAITKVHDLWMEVKEFHVAPDNMTKPALVDTVAAAARRLILPNNVLVEYHSLLIASPEFGVLVPAHDLEFLNTLNDLFDNRRSYRENRRYMGNKQIDIINPQINILAGTQPTYLASLLPEEAWGMGFTSRLLLIYSSEPSNGNLFEVFQHKSSIRDDLAKGMVRISKIYGHMELDSEAKKATLDWIEKGLRPVPEHSKLENYNSRRHIHVLKLAVISAVSKGRSMVMLYDFERAKEWLLDAEAVMPDVFRDMILRSDVQTIQELHIFIWKIYAKEKKPVHQSRLVNFLSARVPSEKIMKILEIAERANVVTREAGTDNYRPRPKNEFGVE
jgi:hypothetical protein